MFTARQGMSLSLQPHSLKNIPNVNPFAHSDKRLIVNSFDRNAVEFTNRKTVGVERRSASNPVSWQPRSLTLENPLTVQSAA